jgi:hypothetical protein
MSTTDCRPSGISRPTDCLQRPSYFLTRQPGIVVTELAKTAVFAVRRADDDGIASVVIVVADHLDTKTIVADVVSWSDVIAVAETRHAAIATERHGSAGVAVFHVDGRTRVGNLPTNLTKLKVFSTRFVLIGRRQSTFCQTCC